MRLGQFTIKLINGGAFKLDGGAMFGVIPKPIWEKKNRSDEKNRISLAANCFLINANGKYILIDTGNGTKMQKKQTDIFEIDKTTTLISSLANEDISPEDIDVVILSHLHFDHAGGATIYNSEGKAVPTFPNAVYVIQTGEWEDAMTNYGIMKGSYVKDNFLPVKEHGNLKLVEGEYDVCPGVKALVTGGHTRTHQIVFIESDRKKAVYLGDLIPTRTHFKSAYGMGFDLFPVDTKEKKVEFLSRASEEEWILLLDHDPKVAACKIKKVAEDKYISEKVDLT